MYSVVDCKFTWIVAILLYTIDFGAVWIIDLSFKFQGEVTPIDSVLTPATGVKIFDRRFQALTP